MKRPCRLAVALLPILAAMSLHPGAHAAPVHYHFEGTFEFNVRSPQGPIATVEPIIIDLDFAEPPTSLVELRRGDFFCIGDAQCFTMDFIPGLVHDVITVSAGTASTEFHTLRASFDPSAFDASGNYVAVERGQKLTTSISAAPPSAAVPEPGSLALALTASGLWAFRTRRGKAQPE